MAGLMGLGGMGFGLDMLGQLQRLMAKSLRIPRVDSRLVLSFPVAASWTNEQ